MDARLPPADKRSPLKLSKERFHVGEMCEMIKDGVREGLEPYHMPSSEEGEGPYHMPHVEPQTSDPARAFLKVQAFLARVEDGEFERREEEPPAAPVEKERSSGVYSRGNQWHADRERYLAGAFSRFFAKGEEDMRERAVLVGVKAQAAAEERPGLGR
jgi:hypothetical protein